MPRNDSNFRPMTAWERERWDEVVGACMSRPGGVEFGPQSKAIVLAVARQLEHVEAENQEIRQLLGCVSDLVVAADALANYTAEARAWLAEHPEEGEEK